MYASLINFEIPEIDMNAEVDPSLIGLLRTFKYAVNWGSIRVSAVAPQPGEPLVYRHSIELERKNGNSWSAWIQGTEYFSYEIPFLAIPDNGWECDPRGVKPEDIIRAMRPEFRAKLSNPTYVRIHQRRADVITYSGMEGGGTSELVRPSYATVNGVKYEKLVAEVLCQENVREWPSYKRKWLEDSYRMRKDDLIRAECELRELTSNVERLREAEKRIRLQLEQEEPQ